MSEKKVTLVVNRPPDFYSAEKLRMAVGLTLEDDNTIRVLFVDEGVFCVNGIELADNPAKMEINKSLETLGMMGAGLYIHAPSMESTDMVAEKYKMLPLDEQGAGALLEESDTIIS